ncbi:hypothetical protein F4695_004487 [Rhizobium soli]|uniref:Phage ABA sandwich domain-containing protein n=1 Tax=Rhizobium soli TaxID=424798 RepID=A0A7X0JQ45_9HYPH|nr:hypothetical protein [Rhizobium soli]MBB6511089.1 hypothetical protein [Rhizobium soli]
MKTIPEIIELLTDATGPNRHLDFQIAHCTGWRQHSERDKSNDQKVVWLHPESEEPAKVPAYTKSVQEAWRLVKQLSSDRPGAAAWEEHYAKVRLDGEEVVFAPTLALALCLAAVKLLERNPEN